MDESVELFRAEQKRLADEGGTVRSLKWQITSHMIALGVFATVIWVLMAGLGAFPRNPDNSVKLIYFGPALVALSTIAGLFLRKGILRSSPLRFAASGVIALTVIAIPAGAIDFLTRNGS